MRQRELDGRPDVDVLDGGGPAPGGMSERGPGHHDVAAADDGWEVAGDDVLDAYLEDGLAERLSVARRLVAVENVRGGISKKSMIHNDATPDIRIDPETYSVVADGELLVCEPAKELPLAQRYFLY